MVNSVIVEYDDDSYCFCSAPEVNGRHWKQTAQSSVHHGAVPEHRTQLLHHPRPSVHPQTWREYLLFVSIFPDRTVSWHSQYIVAPAGLPLNNPTFLRLQLDPRFPQALMQLHNCRGLIRSPCGIVSNTLWIPSRSFSMSSCEYLIRPQRDKEEGFCILTCCL